MLNEPTIEKLYSLRLVAMAEALCAQQRDDSSLKLDFDERFAMLVDAEYLTRENRRLARLLKQAGLRIGDACVEDISATAARGLDKATLRRLASLDWLSQRMNVLVTGPPASARATSRVPWVSSPVDAATRCCTGACRGSSRRSHWPRPTAPTRGCSPRWVALRLLSARLEAREFRVVFDVSGAAPSRCLRRSPQSVGEVTPRYVRAFGGLAYVVGPTR